MDQTTIDEHAAELRPYFKNRLLVPKSDHFTYAFTQSEQMKMACFEGMQSFEVTAGCIYIPLYQIELLLVETVYFQNRTY